MEMSVIVSILVTRNPRCGDIQCFLEITKLESGGDGFEPGFVRFLSPCVVLHSPLHEDMHQYYSHFSDGKRLSNLPEVTLMVRCDLNSWLVPKTLL